MTISKKNLKQYAILILSFIIALIVLGISDNLYVHVLTFIGFVAIVILLVKMNLLHPYCWLSGFFCLYSIGYPLMYSLGFSQKIGYSKEIMIYQLIALFVCLLFITPKEVQYPSIGENYSMQINIGSFNKVIFAILIISIIFAAAFVSQSGFSGKGEIYESGSFLLKMIFRFPLIISLLYSLSIVSYYYQNKVLPKKLIVLVSVSLVIITLFSGERDFIFRFLIMNLLILWSLKVLSVKHLFIIIPSFILLVPLSSMYKYFFLRGEISIQYNSFLQSFLSGEFESASRNLQVLVNHSDIMRGIKGFGQLFWDIISVFNSNIQSPTAWFNEIFYAGSQSQYGFSLVGEGYIMGGVVGIIFLFSVLGLMIRMFYKYSYKNLYLLSAYFYFITVVIYSIRADFGTILAAVLKQIALVLCIIYLFERFSKPKS